MKAWLKRIELDRFAATRIPLPEGAGAITVGRASNATVSIDSVHVSRTQLRVVSDGGRWRVEDDHSTGGTWLNGHRISEQLLTHGDVLDLHGTLLVFVDREERSNPTLESAISLDGRDAGPIRVWADWLQEHGDPLGEELAAGRAGDAALEGLAPLVAEGKVELGWREGLVERAVIRCTSDSTYQELQVLGRLTSLRVCRWLRELRVDVSPWNRPSSGRLYGDASSVLRSLTGAHGLMELSQLSLGYVTTELEPSPFFQGLLERLPKRFPQLVTPLERVLPVARHAWLETLSIPPGLDFHHDGQPDQRRVSLDAGVWVGSSRPGSLRALTPGVRRDGLVESFIVRQEPPTWCLVPMEFGMKLNGHRAVPTRLLDGDELETATGAKFRFIVS